ncbi:MAG: bifunctional 4-hydroxy-2-oxoglutarate aldolase/2-dehydro-3-deoxy-phosphogluconate aldolase [Candidatus Planktophila sp.]
MIELIRKLRIVPVVSVKDSSTAADIASALIEGGLPIVEFTLRSPASLQSLKIAAQNDGLTVGVGSLRNVDDLRQAIDVGAKFAVSAGFSPTVATEANRLGIPYFPGVATPTEILQAIDSGITTLKFFPAETIGGVNALSAMSAPFPGVSYMPTGGITSSNAPDYLSIPSVVAVGGSWMVSAKLIEARDFDSIVTLTREAVEACA